MKDKLIYFLGAAVLVLGTAILLNERLARNLYNEKQAIQTSEFNNLSVITESDDTKDWNVFKHDELGFSIKYPDNVVVWQNTSDWVVFTPAEYSETDYFPVVYVQVIDRANPDNSVKTALRNETPLANGEKNINSRKIKINNAIGVQALEGFVSKHHYYLNDQGNKGPVILLFLGTDIAYENPDLSNPERMISTFRFER